MRLEFNAHILRVGCESIPGFRACLTPRCKNGGIPDEANPKLDCYTCGAVSCLACGIEWHEGRTCADVQRELRIAAMPGEAAFEEMRRREGFKCCPGCGANISRTEGCDAMHCRCGIVCVAMPAPSRTPASSTRFRHSPRFCALCPARVASSPPTQVLLHLRLCKSEDSRAARL